MSKYLQIKMLKALQGAESSEDVRGDVVSEGINSLKNNISEYKTDGEYKPFLSKVEHTPNYEGTELAEVAIDVYRNNIKPKPEPQKAYESNPTPPAAGQRHHMQGVARALASMRNGGDNGRLRQDAGPNGGDMRVGDGRVIHTEERTIVDMSVEEYTEYLQEKNDFPKDAPSIKDAKPQKKTDVKYDPHMKTMAPQVNKEETELEGELLVEDPVKDLEEKLLEMKEHSWQSIDKVMRGICKEYDITPKQLHKDFKSSHGGQIPDDWVKQNQVAEECGWFPLNEVAINRRGHAFDVSLYWKGHTRRLKFFWPDLAYPKKDAMQKAAEMFYPGSKLLTFYPTREDSNDFMVLVPPMSENFEYIPMEAWTELTEEQNDILNQIEEEEGEIVSGVEIDDGGALTFFISDNETGEDRQVIVEDDMKGMSQKSGDKRSTDSGAGLTAKGVAKYRARNPGSKLKTAVTTPPSKLKAGSKAAGRRKSFCARSRGWNGERGKAARARWNC